MKRKISKKTFRNSPKMKKTVTILVILFVTYSIAVHGQKDTWSGYNIISDVNGTNRGKMEWISDDANSGVLYVYSEKEDGQWKETKKRERRFDHYGNLVELVEYERDAAENSFEVLNMSFEFDDNGNVISSTLKDRSLGQESWRIDAKVIYEYNENYENIAKHEYEHANKKGHYTIDYQYDERGNCIVRTVSDAVKNVLDMKTEYGYDAENNLISTLTYQWFGSWIERQKREYEYDMNKNRIVDMHYKYLSWSQIWEEEQKVVYVYDDNNRIIGHSQFNWNIVMRDWNLDSKTEYSYDNSGNIVSINRSGDIGYPGEWAWHETVTYSNVKTRSSKKDEISVNLDAGSGAFIRILGAAGARITVVEPAGFIHYVRGNAGDFETIPTLTLPIVIFVNIERDGTRLTRIIVK